MSTQKPKVADVTTQSNFPDASLREILLGSKAVIEQGMPVFFSRQQLDEAINLMHQTFKASKLAAARNLAQVNCG